MARSTGLFIALLAAAVVTVVVVDRTDQPAGPPLSGPATTLVTGDQVRIDKTHGVVATPAPGREGIDFTIWTDRNGHLHVLPEDASAALAAGRLDPRLFDITEMMAAGKDAALYVDLPGANPTTESVERTSEAWARAQHAEQLWLLTGHRPADLVALSSADNMPLLRVDHGN